MKIGVVGKTNVGKSTFFSAATLIDVKISDRIFTTIKPNIGIGYVSIPCVCKELGVKCKPKNSKCEGGTRLIPVNMIDVAGLVPDAHLGRGLGNKFLNDLMEADGLIHIVDMSGKTDAQGNPTDEYNPENDIKFLEKEIDYWIEGILRKNWSNIERKVKAGKELWECVYEQISGLKISPDFVKETVKKGYSDLLDLASKIRKNNKPMILAGNKIDLPSSPKNYEAIKDKYEVIPTFAEGELALRRAAKKGLIKYVPGAASFEILKKLAPEQERALNFVKEKVLAVYGSTGVQTTINKLVFEKLNYFPVYPVEDENKFADKKGNVLPDVYLMKKGQTALDLAYKIHSDIGEKFIGAIDARTKKKIGKEYILKKNDIIKILTKA